MLDAPIHHISQEVVNVKLDIRVWRDLALEVAPRRVMTAAGYWPEIPGSTNGMQLPNSPVPNTPLPTSTPKVESTPTPPPVHPVPPPPPPVAAPQGGSAPAPSPAPESTTTDATSTSVASNSSGGSGSGGGTAGRSSNLFTAVFDAIDAGRVALVGAIDAGITWSKNQLAETRDVYRGRRTLNAAGTGLEPQQSIAVATVLGIAAAATLVTLVTARVLVGHPALMYPAIFLLFVFIGYRVYRFITIAKTPPRPVPSKPRDTFS